MTDTSLLIESRRLTITRIGKDSFIFNIEGCDLEGGNSVTLDIDHSVSIDLTLVLKGNKMLKMEE